MIQRETTEPELKSDIYCLIQQPHDSHIVVNIII